MRVVIHADASPETGTGHVVRCLALASALRAGGADVALASDRLVASLAHSAAALGVEVVERRDAPRRADWVIFDGYEIDAPARQRLAGDAVHRLVIDDLGGEIDADVVVNQNLYASPAGPTRAMSGELLAGPAYALLRPEFTDVTPSRDQPPVAGRILVTMGGSDPHDATSAVIRSLSGIQDAEIRIIIGAAHPAPDRIEGAATAAGFELEREASTLAPHLAWADVVVSGCGTTVLEATRLGRPVVGIVLADNQVAVAEALEREELGTIAGGHPNLDERRVRLLVDALRNDVAARTRIAERGPQLVDGGGARRVARVLSGGPLRLRAASAADADLLLAWRNDPATRAASFDTAEIARLAHVAWLDERLHSDDDRLWIGVVGDQPAGVIRFALEDDTATASVTVAPEQRGRGLATRLVASGCARLAKDGAASRVDAWIRPENVASMAAFRAAGFRPASGSAERLRYSLSTASVP